MNPPRREMRTFCLNHGSTQMPEYLVWRSMHARCYNPATKSYKHYGARGIKVCDRWRIFENFSADMGHRPEGYSIERIDNNGDYEPSNCRWATRIEQCSNRRYNRLLTFKGVTKTLSQWARDIGVKRTTLRQRLFLGWSVDRALTETLRAA